MSRESSVVPGKRATVAEQDVHSLFAVDFLVAVHRDHDGRVKLRVVNLEGEIAGDLAVVADPSAVLLEAERVVPVVVVVAQAVPLETFGLQLGTDQCACVDLAAVVIGNAQRS